jgi:hypothetical protein
MCQWFDSAPGHHLFFSPHLIAPHERKKISNLCAEPPRERLLALRCISSSWGYVWGIRDTPSERYPHGAHASRPAKRQTGCEALQALRRRRPALARLADRRQTVAVEVSLSEQRASALVRPLSPILIGRSARQARRDEETARSGRRPISKEESRQDRRGRGKAKHLPLGR